MITIEDIVTEEWRQFQLVNNEGGRAGCQDNELEFYIMRKSQFLAWTDEIIKSYYKDLMRAKAEGRNLLFEKYAYMMKNTDPQKYESLKAVLPAISEKKKLIIQRIADIQVSWAEDFQKRYPAYAKKGRPVYAREETIYETSIETYLHGELSSYGEKTIELYAAFIEKCRIKGHNLTDIVRENMARLYGYSSIEMLEKKFVLDGKKK